MNNIKEQLKEAIAKSTASEYDKENILYLAGAYADERVKSALFEVAKYETGSNKT